MIGDVKMQTVKQKSGRSLTGDRPFFFSAGIIKFINCLKKRLYIYIYKKLYCNYTAKFSFSNFLVKSIIIS